MTNPALSDCIRSTPSRTIGALIMVVASRAVTALNKEQRARETGQGTKAKAPQVTAPDQERLAA